MAESGPLSAPAPKVPLLTQELKKRVVSALILAPIALAAVYLGGWVSVVVTTIVALLILNEWHGVTSERVQQRLVMVEWAVLIAVAIVLGAGFKAVSAGFVAFLTLAVAFFALRADEKAWIAGGLVYALLFPLATVLILNSGQFGFAAAIFICFIVWTTDVFAYFAGKGIGGAKLWPAISPKKTWAGFVGGLGGGVVAGYVLSMALGLTWSLPLALVSFGLSLAGHAGDLFESWVKRCFHKKDSGDLIPGHGGVMDRVDGLLAAFVAAMIFGTLRSGLNDCAAGIVSW